MKEMNTIPTETLQLVLDNTQAMIYVCDVDTYEVIFANKALQAGFDSSLTGTKCWQMLSPFDGPCPYCKLPEVLKMPMNEPLVWENFNPSMNSWLQMSNSIVRWPDGRNAHLISVTDISSIKKREEEIERYKKELEVMLREKTESETMLRSLSDNLPDSFVFQFKGDPNKILKTSFISRGIESICNINVKDITEDAIHFLNIFSPEDSAMLRDFASKGKKIFSQEFHVNVKGKDEPVWLLLSGIVRKADDGETIMDGLAIDITSRKKMESELERSQAELLHNSELIQEISNNMYGSALYRTHIDDDGRIILDYATKQMEQLVGIPVERLKEDLGLFFSNIHPDDAATVLPRIASTTASLVPETTEFRHVDEGGVRWYRLQSRGFRLGGQIVRDGMVIDITAQKELELQLIAARDEARESERLKSAFLANMSHEIRTPMNAIIGFLDFMMVEEDIPPQSQREYMRIVSDNAKQLLKLIGDILDISKIDAGQMKIIPEEVNVNMLLQDIRSSFIAASDNKLSEDVILSIDMNGQDPVGIFTVDQARLRQILNNIIGNAIKFTSRGYVKYGYSVVPGEGLKFFVEDTGIGISKNKLKDIGKPFYQLHDTSKSAEYGGTGIGLAISTNLVKLMGGWFNVDSELGKGSRFEFLVPCKELEPKGLGAGLVSRKQRSSKKKM